MATERLSLRVEMEACGGRDQIMGRILSEDGPAQPYTGWLQLLSALQGLATTLREPVG
jgi:hypothetical protein